MPELVEAQPPAFEAWEVELHGHQVVYRDGRERARRSCSSTGWSTRRGTGARSPSGSPRDYTVIAPDLIGHGDSATPRGDYSLGAHAVGDPRPARRRSASSRATIVGHSLGGGVAMEFFWQFPERVERLALVSSGGPRPPRSARCCAVAALPGASRRWSRSRRDRRVTAALDRRATVARARLAGSACSSRRSPGRCGRCRAAARAPAFLQTLRAVIDPRGQRVAANDRLYLLGPVPIADRLGRARPHDPDRARPRRPRGDPAQPVRTLPRAAHFPHLEDPDGLADVLEDFVAGTEPARIDEETWQALVRDRATTRLRPRSAA